MDSAAAADGEAEDGGNSNMLSNVIGRPLEYMKSIIPGYTSTKEKKESTDLELMGDKLRKKRMKTKRKSQAIGQKQHSFELDVKRKRLGSQRSMVRYIGSNVPMVAPYKREYFEMIDHSRRSFMTSASTFISTNFDQVRQHVDQVKYHVVPTLADLGQLVWEDLNDYEEDEEGEDENQEEEDEIVDENVSVAIETNPSDVASTSLTTCSSEAPKPDSTKISALEDELAKLRAQIAMIVSAQQPQMAPSQPTQVAVVAPTPMFAPPPPPPPPPPLPVMKLPTINVNKPPLRKNNSLDNKKESANMDDVLKGLANVKLKTSDISRSPGGTPLKKNPTRSDSNNHADIIARALQEKFRNTKTTYDSPDKSDFGSPYSSFTPTPPRANRTESNTNVVRPIPAPRPRKKTQDSTALNLSYS